MKNKIPIIILAIAIVIPQVASAVWWNPFSWFESEETFINKVKYQATTTEEKIESQTEPIIETKDEPKPVIQEKIIEKTITVDNPELQKKINALLQENIDLKSRIVSLTTNLNSCRASNAESISNSDTGGNTEVIYSDFNFNPTFNNAYSANVLLIPQTSREIIIKKAVFNTDDPRNVVSVSVGTKVFEKQGDSTFVYIGSGIPISHSLVFTVYYGGTAGIGKITPDFSKWEVWDNTTNKPIKME